MSSWSPHNKLGSYTPRFELEAQDVTMFTPKTGQIGLKKNISSSEAKRRSKPLEEQSWAGKLGKRHSRLPVTSAWS